MSGRCVGPRVLPPLPLAGEGWGEGPRHAANAAEAMCDLPTHFTPCEYRVKWADGGWEINEARRLRRAVFCAEQGVFVGDDLDAVDAHAQPLVALSCVGGMNDQVVGTVRIHRGIDPATQLFQEGVWWGSRLAVHTAFRSHGRLGATLIRLAVSSARARGCSLFLAHVQSQNQTMFEKLHWHPLRDEMLHGRPHVLMQADLSHYPPCHDPLTGFVTRSVSAGGRGTRGRPGETKGEGRGADSSAEPAAPTAVETSMHRSAA